MSTAEEREQWYEPDGTPVEVGLHSHDAIWDHEGRKWDEVQAQDHTKGGLDKERWRRAQERVIATTSYSAVQVCRLSNAVAAEYVALEPTHD